MSRALAALAFALLVPAANPAAAEEGAVSGATDTPALADSVVPDEDLRAMAAILGRRLASQTAGDAPNADKLMMLGRDESGAAVVVGIMLLTSRQSPPADQPGVLALVRTQRSKSKTVPGPAPADLAFVADHAVPLFIVGEWARPAPVWEIARIDGAVRFRPIGESGEIGPWQD